MDLRGKGWVKESISIAIPVYNRELYLAQAVESVLAQTRTDFELVIWDDGSTDRSLDIARRYEESDQRVKVFSSAHQGQPHALISALERTSGNYLGWVDSDDFLEKSALAETSAILDSESEVGLVYTDYMVVDASGKVLGLGHHCKRPYSQMTMLVEFITFHFRLLRRSIYDFVGGLDPAFESAYDYDLCLRMTERAEVRHVAKPLYNYRTHRETMSRQKRLAQISCTQRAILNAIKRRGLDSEYELELNILERYRLVRKI
jgi:glycosyltransferase involved in cell wall biosynthesis